MSALTADLVFTLLASLVVLAAGVVGILVLPRKEEDWNVPDE